ncbi:TonB family protein [Desulfomonile tiedjei]|uniref:TonB family protein n=1 Tax=Desulfomonile tiedjei TaxID=2358 RepID=UPI00030A39CE|nr:TonB family protein [Desulfomonile tiedjei]
MKKLAIVLFISGLLAVHCGSAWADQIVVDRSTRNKTLNDYTLLTRDAIQRAWTAPLNLEIPTALKGRMRITYSVDRDGSLQSVEMIQSSGNKKLDRSLIAAIRSAAPFPPFPDDLRADNVLIRANFIVADVPTVPVVTANHEVRDRPIPIETEPDKSPKKYIWGVPAGSSNVQDVDAKAEKPDPGPARKYKWGLDNN